jgi:hypothetical protein
LQEAYSVFVQSLVEPNEREFYYQPSRDAFRRLLEVVFLTQPKNYEVAERRVSRARVDRALALYYEAFWNLDDDLNPVSPRTDALVQILQSAFEGYAATTESPNGPGFAAYVRNRGGAAASEMERLRKLFAEIRSLGLTRQEREVSYRVLLAPISGFGLPTAELIEALQEPEITNQMVLNP